MATNQEQTRQDLAVIEEMVQAIGKFSAILGIGSVDRFRDALSNVSELALEAAVMHDEAQAATDRERTQRVTHTPLGQSGRGS